MHNNTTRYYCPRVAALLMLGYSSLMQAQGASFSVLSYGAKGDGVTDDTAAIVRTIALAGPSGVVVFPAATYRVTRTIQIASGQTYQGTDGAILSTTGGYPILSSPSNATGITIDSLTFNGAGIAFPGYGVASRIQVTNCTFQNILPGNANWPSHFGIFIGGAGMTDSQIASNRFNNILDGGRADAIDRLAGGIIAYNLNRVSLTGNTFDTVNQAFSLKFEGAGPYYDVLVAANSGNRVHRMGIECQGGNSFNLIIDGNTFSNFLNPFWNTFGLSIVVNRGTGTIVRNNTLSATPDPPSGGRYGYGIELSGIGTGAYNNRISGKFSTGIAIGMSTGINVSGNTLCGDKGTMLIQNEVGSTSTGATITSNTTALTCSI